MDGMGKDGMGKDGMGMDATDDRHRQGGERHPEELLAPYVDGTATPAERTAVEAHLGSCARCRDEVDLARSAHRALAALPEVRPTTGVTAAGVTVNSPASSPDTPTATGSSPA